MFGSPAKLLSRQREQSIQSQTTRGGHWNQVMGTVPGVWVWKHRPCLSGLPAGKVTIAQADTGPAWPSPGVWVSLRIRMSRNQNCHLDRAGWVTHSQGGWACALVSTHPTQEEGGSATESDSAQPGSRELLGRAVQSWLRKATVPAAYTRSPEPASGDAPNFPQKPKKPRRRSDAAFSPCTGFQPPPASREY